MRKYRKEALKSLGIDVERYYVEGDPPIWGIALVRDGATLAVVEQTPRAHDYTGDGKYHVRSSRTEEGQQPAPSFGAFRTQREAIAGWVRYAASIGVV